jgi:hypothetical protein
MFSGRSCCVVLTNEKPCAAFCVASEQEDFYFKMGCCSKYNDKNKGKANFPLIGYFLIFNSLMSSRYLTISFFFK